MKIDLDWPSGTFIFTTEDDGFTVVGTPDPGNDTYALLLYRNTDAGAELVALASAVDGHAAQELAHLTLAELAVSDVLPWSV